MRNNDKTGALLDEIVHFEHLEPTLEACLQEIRSETQQDRVLQELINIILTGWPEEVSKVQDAVRHILTSKTK